MAFGISSSTSTDWNCDFATLRRQNLFQNPPKDRSAHPLLLAAVSPHIESFNAIFGKRGLLEHAIDDIGTKLYVDNEQNVLRIQFKNVALQMPQVPSANKWARNRNIYPAECRERHATYRGRFSATIQYRVNHNPPVEVVRELGQLPVMVKSSRCHLQDMPPAELVSHKEESEELGGYFIVNGNEKLIRFLVQNRRNFPLAIDRPSFAKRGPGYTSFGIIVRSVRPDETSQTNVLHYLKDGNVTFRFSWKKKEYMVPVMMILKALVETNDLAIFQGLVGGTGSEGTPNTWLSDRVELLLRTFQSYNLYTKSKSRSYLGERFRNEFGLPETVSHYDAGTEFLRRVVLVHLGSVAVTEKQNTDKFALLIFMIRKLYALAAGDCAVDNADAVQNQEVVLGGFLYAQILKERLDDLLGLGFRNALRDYVRRRPGATFTTNSFGNDVIANVFRRANENIGHALEYFLSTGNLQSPSGLDLQQTSGFTVVAEKLNFLRFISHFRMVHRGSFFQQLKTTTVRKLLPESWGFLCPVHTPDGGPCGLLNHLAHECGIVTKAVDASAIPKLAVALGVKVASSSVLKGHVVVMLDGRIIGWCAPEVCRRLADTLRHWKVEGSHDVPKQLEIGYVPSSTGGSYPGIYMTSTAARMIRPVKYLPLDQEDFVGPHEQPYMSIAVCRSEVIPGETTHVEFDPTHILSILANMTPFSDFNQSPRNMYQCQMGKQTMGTPGTALRYRTDNKMYLLQTGQTPIVRSPLHNAYGFDHFPNGMNAVVAVISYTGYDMDDAMIINKSAHERGFAHGSIYKTKKISIKEEGSRARTARGVTKVFGFNPTGKVWTGVRGKLDDDGLPHVGQKVEAGDPLCAWYSVKTGYDDELVNVDAETHLEKYRDLESGYIEEVRLIGNEHGNEPLQAISIKFRIPRSPVIGDKFSSRHGQKGVCSQKWPTVDMPFSESGIQPDVIINPHAFPSRMTIGMFVESMAGKAGALHGLAQDSTPFRFDEENTAADYFGHQLMKAGFNYHGNEPMYSGITGKELHADIYIGVVYYQRLRHMVNDKYQVRTTGAVVQTTGQPIKGRKRGGGIRVGEMERDSLLAHGTSFLLQDRLMNCSDYTRAWLCRSCGSFLATQPAVPPPSTGRRRPPPSVHCRLCAERATGDNERSGETWEDGQGQVWVGGANTTQVAVPGALKYLDVELASMGIKLKYRLGNQDQARNKPPKRESPGEIEAELRSIGESGFGANEPR